MSITTREVIHMQPIMVSKAPYNELFNSEKCNIGNGAVIIELRNCDVKINPTLTIDSAAKLAARQIYQVMEHPNPLSQEPEWLNSVSFASEEMPDKPAIRIVDNKLYINSPPFKNNKKNINFWKRFTDYWYVMVVKAMNKALIARKDKTFFEEQTINRYANIDV
jgi:hypothetical protein